MHVSLLGNCTAIETEHKAGVLCYDVQRTRERPTIKLARADQDVIVMSAQEIKVKLRRNSTRSRIKARHLVPVYMYENKAEAIEFYTLVPAEHTEWLIAVITMKKNAGR